jgi:hypothetical protein
MLGGEGLKRWKNLAGENGWERTAEKLGGRNREKWRERNDSREREGKFGRRETAGKFWREKKCGRERAEKFGGKNKNQCQTMPTVPLGIDLDCDAIWREEK